MTFDDLLVQSARLRAEAHENVEQAKRVRNAFAEMLARPVASTRTAPVADERAMAKALHLAAAIQVVRAHQRCCHVSVAETRRAIQETALRVAKGMAGPETRELAAKLEKMTSVTVGELGMITEDWPEI